MKSMRVPFSIGEEILHFADSADEPMNNQFEVRVAGAFDEERLRKAIVAALRVHPIARARRVAPRFLFRAPQWEIGEAAAADVLSVIECESDSDLNAARGDFYNKRIGIEEAPALRFLLARRPGGDALLLSASHAITDGLGVMRLFRSVARAYAGVADPVPDVDPLAARHLKRQFGGDFPPRANKAPRLTTIPGRPSFIAPDKRDHDAGYVFSHVSVPSEQRRRLNPARFCPGATLNDLLLAALHHAIAVWNARLGQPCDTTSVLMPVSLRPREWYNEVVGNLVMSGEVISTPEQRSSSAALLKAVTEQTQRIRSGDRFASVLGTPAWLYNQFPLILLLLRFVTRDRGRSAAVLTFMGRIERDAPDFGPDAGEITEVWGTPPAVSPLGLSIGAGHYHGRLFLTFRFRRAVLDDAAARRFSSTFVESLMEFAEGGPPRVAVEQLAKSVAEQHA
jgi:NRPS condensation-like uncharacterized protein